MRTLAGLRVAIVVLFVGACGTAGPSTVSPPATTTPTTTVPSRSPAQSAAPTPDAAIVGGERPVPLHLPTPRRQAAMPLLVLLHGYGGNGAENEDWMRVGREATRRGMAFVAPDGTKDSDGNRFWNATDACCDLDGSGIDDAGYLADLIEKIQTVASVDPKRIYLVGHSNGGYMSYRMACDHADVVAAIVSLAGATPGRPDDCRPSEPVAVLQIHGTADDVVKFDGGDLSDVIGANGSARTYPGARETVTSWAGYDGCARELVDLKDTVDVDAVIYGPSGPAETTIAEATGCEPGGHAELWTIPNGGHGPNLSATFAASVVDFLLSHPKP